MIGTLFRNFQFCVQNNGLVSKFYRKGRGVNQGCPASPICYVICSEMLAHLIKQNSNINGISLYGVKEVLSQFADDTSAFLSYERDSIEGFYNSLTCIETNLGLKVSYEKTTLYRVGSIHKTDAKIYTTKNLKWSDGPIDTLGVSISCDLASVESNFLDIIAKVNSVCESWQNRMLTLMGKVLVINMLMGSIFVYKLMTVLKLSQNQLEIINGIFSKYLWKGRRAHITRGTLYQKEISRRSKVSRPHA